MIIRWEMKLTILVDNYVNTSKLKAEHGWSILIDTNDERILFDCGQSDLIIGNAEALGIDLNGITKIILSHGHFDHTGGLLPLLKYINRKIDVYAHPLIFEEKFSEYKNYNGKKDNRYIGIPEKLDAYEKKGARFIFKKSATQISKFIYLSGQIQVNGKEEFRDPFFIRKENNFVRDPMYDDISIFINLPELLIVVTGCAHRGIINILNKSKELKLNNKELVIIGGLHLANRGRIYIYNIISELKKYDIKLFVPAHCTGLYAFSELKNFFGDKCIFGSVGKILEF